MNKTAAVVVTYNRMDILKKNLDCLLKQRGDQCDIIVINNASTDGTEYMILKDYNIEQVKYYNTGSNIGGAGGFEFGMGKAVALGYEYIWVMDDDTLPSEDALTNLLKADKELGGKWGFLSSAVFWKDNNLCKANTPKTTLFTFIGKRHLKKKFTKVVMGSFVSLFVRTSVVKQVGLPIGQYFIWTDDYEYSGRISRLYPCYFVASSKVMHAMKINTKANVALDDISRMNRYRLLFRNDVHCYKQFGVYGWLYIHLKKIFMSAKVLISARDNTKRRLDTIAEGYKEGLIFEPVIKKDFQEYKES